MPDNIETTKGIVEYFKKTQEIRMCVQETKESSSVKEVVYNK